ncbi:MAG: hypothetical protein ACLRZ2_07195 [Veillonella sp.]
MVAGFITGFERRGSQEALYWGISSGSASAYSENLATLAEVETLLYKYELTSLHFICIKEYTYANHCV